MSLILRFIEIEKTAAAIVSENRTIGVCEVNNDKIIKVDEFYTKNTDLFDKLLKDPHSIWQGEYYNIPWMNHFAFYILGLDFESNTGYRKEGDSIITLAWEPKSIEYIVSAAKSNIPSIKDSLDRLDELAKNAIQNDHLIMVSWN